jgi:predicted secreted protein
LTDVLGFELHNAMDILAREGYAVTCAQVSSKKGVSGNEARVVRVRRTGDDSVELTYAVFKTDVDYLPEGTGLAT